MTMTVHLDLVGPCADLVEVPAGPVRDMRFVRDVVGIDFHQLLGNKAGSEWAAWERLVHHTAGLDRRGTAYRLSLSDTARLAAEVIESKVAAIRKDRLSEWGASGILRIDFEPLSATATPSEYTAGDGGTNTLYRAWIASKGTHGSWVEFCRDLHREICAAAERVVPPQVTVLRFGACFSTPYMDKQGMSSSWRIREWNKLMTDAHWSPVATPCYRQSTIDQDRWMTWIADSGFAVYLHPNDLDTGDAIPHSSLSFAIRGVLIPVVWKQVQNADQARELGQWLAGTVLP